MRLMGQLLDYVHRPLPLPLPMGWNEDAVVMASNSLLTRGM